MFILGAICGAAFWYFAGDYILDVARMIRDWTK